MMRAIATHAPATVVETASVYAQRLLPMVTSVVNTGCQSSGERRSCVQSSVRKRKAVVLSTRPVTQPVPEPVKACVTSLQLTVLYDWRVAHAQMAQCSAMECVLPQATALVTLETRLTNLDQSW